MYDTETGLYYLQSRYYDPVTCRFINADSYISTSDDIDGFNMFAYCNNNPVIFSDPTGNHAVDITCGDPTCIKCSASRREYINNNTEWYNRIMGTNIVGVTDSGQWVVNV